MSLPPARYRLGVPLLIAAVGTALTIGLFLKGRSLTAERLRVEFESDASLRAAIVADAIKEKLWDLDAVRRLFDSSEEVLRREFSAFVGPAIVSRGGGVQAVEWVPYVPGAQRKLVEEMVQREGLAGFRFTERSPDRKMVPASPREAHYPCLYVEPLGGNEEALGFDLASDPVRFAALRAACDSGGPVVSEGLVLLQGRVDRTGFLVVVPVFRKGQVPSSPELRRAALAGFVVGAYRAGDLVKDALKNTPQMGLPTDLLDLSAPPQRRNLHLWGEKPLPGTAVDAEGQRRTALKLEQPFSFCGRQWRVDVTASTTYHELHRERWHRTILPIGLVLTALVALYMRLVLGQREYAEELVRERTDEFRESESRFRQLLQSLDDVVWARSLDGRRTLYVNEAVARLTGFPSSRFAADVDFWISLIHQDDVQKVRDALTRLLDLCTSECEYRIVRADGELVWVNERGALVRDEQGRRSRLAMLITDVTERRRSEEERRTLHAQLIHSQKLEAVGQLAGGIAHDFNNLLTAILGYVDLLLADRSISSTTAREALSEVQQAGQRARDLTRQLLAFGRKQVLHAEISDINEVVRGFVKMLRRLIGEDIEIDMRLEREPWPVNIDVAQIEQVLLNLGVNARDAMPGGGKLAVRTGNVVLEAPRSATAEMLMPGSYVRLTVSDTGCGMDEETLHRAFEPFFTTKDEGKGTGLGLATVIGIVKQHSGDVVVESEVGKGSTFEVYIPMAQETDVRPDAVAEPMEVAEPAAGTILVVEDEDTLRHLAVALLSREGYAVIEATSPADALDYATRHPECLDLVLADVVLPEMSGPDVVAQILERSPRTRVLYMSGYEGELLGAHGFHELTAPFIAKPFRAKDLVAKVREVMASPGPGPA